jgi:hypothetical protein
MKTTKTLSAADRAVHELLREIPRQRIDEDLKNAIEKAKLWYALHSKRLRMPTGKATKGKR